MNFFFVWVSEFDFAIVWGSKLTWFLCGSKLTVRVEMDIFLVLVID